MKPDFGKNRLPVMLRSFFILFSLAIFPFGLLYSQDDNRWTLDQCIQYALKQYTQERNQAVNGKATSLNFSQPELTTHSALSGKNIRNSFGDDNSLSRLSGYSGGTGSKMVLQKTPVTTVNRWSGIREGQTAIALQAEGNNAGNTRESISLKVLDAYLQVLFAQEKAEFLKKQTDKTQELLNLPAYRSSTSKLRSLLSSEKTLLENTLSQISIDKIILIKVMDLQSKGEINIVRPDLSHFPDNRRVPDAAGIYETALALNPSLRTSDFSIELKEPGKTDFPPSLSAGLSSPNPSGPEGSGMNRTAVGIHQTVGVTLSIPIWQHKQVRTSSGGTRSNQDIAEALKAETRARLKKDIEQTCVAISLTTSEYRANQEKYRAALESVSRMEEKISGNTSLPDDFPIIQNNLIQAENQLLKTKYNLLFSYKRLEMYEGIPLTF
jgi:outer membrane protein